MYGVFVEAGSMVIEGSSMMAMIMFDHYEAPLGHVLCSGWLCPTGLAAGWLLTTEAVVTPLL